MDTFWNDNANAWDRIIDRKSIASRDITNPALVRQVLALGCTSIFDVGCGEGWLGRNLPAAIDYMGIDGSPKLIAAAKKKSANTFHAVSYDELTQGTWTPGRRFDAAVFNFSLFDEDIAPILTKCAELVNPRGYVIVQTLHPCFSPHPYENGWVTEDLGAMDGEIQGSLRWYRRTLRSWTDTFAACGLRTSSIVEPAMNGPPCSIIFVLSRMN